MAERLPKWVEYGAFILALNAGCINAVGLLGIGHQSVSHLSGNTTLLGTELVHLSWLDSWHLIGIIVSFVAGSALSGLMLSGTSLELGRHYESLLIIEATLLFIAISLLKQGIFIGDFCTSMACGLQNGLVTNYSGAVVRTTHVTGIFTDLGLMLGQKLKGKPINKRRLSLFLTIIGGFISGAGIGAYLFENWHFLALALPIIICTSLAGAYHLYRHRQRAANDL